MAVAVIGGLITSTALSLVLVPVVYEFVDDFEGWLMPLLAPLITPEGTAGRSARRRGRAATAGGGVGRGSADRATAGRNHRSANRRARAASPPGSCSSSSASPPAPGRRWCRSPSSGWALDDGALGLLLVCLGVGSIVAMPLAGALAARLGCRPVLLVDGGAGLPGLPAAGDARSAPPFAAALFLFGVGIGSLDCVINIQAIVVEREGGRAMMSGFHALYSLGGFAGAGAVERADRAGAPRRLA